MGSQPHQLPRLLRGRLLMAPAPGRALGTVPEAKGHLAAQMVPRGSRERCRGSGQQVGRCSPGRRWAVRLLEGGQLNTCTYMHTCTHLHVCTHPCVHVCTHLLTEPRLRARWPRTDISPGFGLELSLAGGLGLRRRGAAPGPCTSGRCVRS